MHIVNIMLSQQKGGIEQAFIDYCEVLSGMGHLVTAIVHPQAAVRPLLTTLPVSIVTIRNLGEWDLWAAWRVRQRIKKLNPDIVIAGSNRAISLAFKAIKGNFPLVGVAHNYSTRRLSNVDAVFAITNDLITHLKKQGIDSTRVYHIPNMVRYLGGDINSSYHQPPVIGAMGRFVHKKGFDVFLDALKLLKDRGYAFRAVLGGEGIERESLEKKSKEHGLTSLLEFKGWVDDKKRFFFDIDIFCLPSRHEPFGIVLLEAFANALPTVVTDSEGPVEIVSSGMDALIVRKDCAVSLADGLAKLLDDKELGHTLAANALAKVRSQYELNVVGKRMEKACTAILEKWHLND